MPRFVSPVLPIFLPYDVCMSFPHASHIDMSSGLLVPCGWSPLVFFGRAVPCRFVSSFIDGVLFEVVVLGDVV